MALLPCADDRRIRIVSIPAETAPTLCPTSPTESHPVWDGFDADGIGISRRFPTFRVIAACRAEKEAPS